MTGCMAWTGYSQRAWPALPSLARQGLYFQPGTYYPLAAYQQPPVAHYTPVFVLPLLTSTGIPVATGNYLLPIVPAARPPVAMPPVAAPPRTHHRRDRTRSSRSTEPPPATEPMPEEAVLPATGVPLETATGGYALMPTIHATPDPVPTSL